MNANELADEAEKQSGLIYLVTEKQVAQQLEQMLKNYATMLRQQQAQIEALKEQPTNLQELTLTNDEIKEVIKSLEDSIYFDEKLGFFELKDFALAVLRKAQENG